MRSLRDRLLALASRLGDAARSVPDAARAVQRRLPASAAPGAPAPGSRLLSARQVLARWQKAGGGAAAARELTRAQVSALLALLDDDAAWARLCRLAQVRLLDSWLAADWPEGFDELLLCAPLCHHVAYECARCPVGKSQAGRSCAHPESIFGQVGQLVGREDRTGLRAHLASLLALLDGLDPSGEASIARQR